MSLSDVLSTVRRKEKVLVSGTIARALTLDLFVLNDGTAEVLLNTANLPVSLAAGSKVVAWGRFQGRSDKQPKFAGEIEGIEVALADSGAAADLIKAHGRPAPSPVPAFSDAKPAAGTPVPGRSVETRLRDLDELKAKGLVTDEEYKEQRRRILNDL
ncbi:MAG: SHOCT domain-containing protein [Elusimicrobia bacterium]|nr:SHOCT domain-containing protein [Elusimicrobiota bacterium]